MAANKRYDDFVDERFSLGTGGLPVLPYCVLGLTGEAGEVAEKVKKLYRDLNGKEDYQVQMAIGKELGDVLFYLTKCAHECGFSLTDIENLNIDKLQARDLAGTRRGSGDER